MDTGKEKIKILKRSDADNFKRYCDYYGSENVLQLPCGKCESCIEKRTRAWAVRCVLEAAQYKENSFLTLTYNDDCLPKGGLCKKDFQLFIRRLSYKLGRKVRYFGCGEYGEHTYRPHYHLIVFDWFPSDARFIMDAPYGGMVFRSKELQDLWPFGFASIGEVSFASCGYVARYCQKKLAKGQDTKEFSLMSRHPGIGEWFVRDHLKDIYDTDKIYIKDATVIPFRYFDKVFEAVDPKAFEVVKNVRINNGRLSVASDMLRFGFDHVEKLYDYQASIKKSKFERLKRK